MELERWQRECMFTHRRLSVHVRASMWRQTATASCVVKSHLHALVYISLSLPDIEINRSSVGFNYAVKCTNTSTVDLLSHLHICSVSALMSVLCGHSSIRNIVPLNHCHVVGGITSRGLGRFSWRSRRLRWPRMHCSPRLTSAERCDASQNGSPAHCVRRSLPARILTRVDCSRSPRSCVNNPLDDSLPPHANIIPQNILPPDLSKVLLEEGELYICLYILRVTLAGGVEYRTLKGSWMEPCFCFSQSADFSPFAPWGGSGEKRGPGG